MYLKLYKLTLQMLLILITIIMVGIPVKVYSNNLELGVNGHPFTQTVYENVSAQVQLDLIKDIGARWYRVDCYGQSTQAQQLNKLKEFIYAAQNKGIFILPIIFPPVDINNENDVNKIYEIAYGYAEKLSRALGKDIKIWELDNELDNYAILKKGDLTYSGTTFKFGAPDGIKANDYEPIRTKKAMALLKGLSDGIHATDPTAKLIINAGWLHVGFFDHIFENQIGFEIIGWHWYSNMGDITNVKGKFNLLEKLKVFNKPIWITETNRRGGSYGINGDTEESNYLKSSLLAYKAYSKKYFIENVFIYELLDDPPLGRDNPESYYGIVEVQKNKIGKWEIKSKKSSFDALRNIFLGAP